MEAFCMTVGRVDAEYQRAIGRFCGELRQLRTDAGLSVDALLAATITPPLGLKRSQIYEVLAGRVVEPPAWDFIRVFVAGCAAHAQATRRPLSISTDPEYWRREHGRLTERYQAASRSPGDAKQRPSDSCVPKVLTLQETILYPVPAAFGRRVGVITADIRQVRCAGIWVNSENTDMVMARVQESSTSAIIRYEGARRDAAGRVVEDTVAQELEAQVAGLRPVGPGEVVVTGAGALRERNGVRYIMHVAAVHGQPGAGFHPVAQVGRCVENVLFAAERLDVGPDGWTILFPLLGAGVGGGNVLTTSRTLVHAAVNYLQTVPATRVGTVLFLAYTDVELDACLVALDEAGGIIR
ncbi:macro domain-containing protein [Verrucosispora sp. WMMC514]|uniref:macro domain-containing protein n=1 Tax=Verrucosispora sp. WMMC514 TaxID=3015156 RepID=UPI00248BDD22|nr:macro domain-containing protein [Verrucosispora sp. WMMC514]WBB93377.1 macro domain-containing protein [Verrucosispora sp. WMMC514]